MSPAGDIIARMGTRGRFVLDKLGRVVPALSTPSELDLKYSPAGSPIVGPTRLGELLMVDVRLAKQIAPASRLYEVCQELSGRAACGVVEATLVIDLLEASAPDRLVLLNPDNWPRPEPRGE